MLTQQMISWIGVAGTFGLFAAVTTLGGIYYICYMKSAYGLTLSECKQLYWPEERPSKNAGDPGMLELENLEKQDLSKNIQLIKTQRDTNSDDENDEEAHLNKQSNNE